jgi:hypothetical protein
MLRLHSPLRRRAAAAVLGAALCLGLANGCGGNGDSKKVSERTSRAAGGVPTLGAHPDPYKLTCSDIGNRENYPPVYDAAVILARAADLRDASDQQTATRLYAAVHDLCAKRANPAYRPAKDALVAVKRGEYRTESALP